MVDAVDRATRSHKESFGPVVDSGEDKKMTDTPWQGDACSLVDAFRAGERSPLEETEASLAAISESKLNLSLIHISARRSPPARLARR